MKQIILDTSFIITCLKQKIDFFEELVGTKILIPEQVINELKNTNSSLALKLLEKNKFTKIDLRKRFPSRIASDFVVGSNQNIDKPCEVGSCKKIANRNREGSSKETARCLLGKCHVDKLIINFAKENPKIIIATLDKEIKEKTKNQKLIIRGKKKLEIV